MIVGGSVIGWLITGFGRDVSVGLGRDVDRFGRACLGVFAFSCCRRGGNCSRRRNAGGGRMSGIGGADPFLGRIAQGMFGQARDARVQPATVPDPVDQPGQGEEGEAATDHGQGRQGGAENGTGSEGQCAQGWNVNQAPGPPEKGQQGDKAGTEGETPLCKLVHRHKAERGQAVDQAGRQGSFHPPSTERRQDGIDFSKYVKGRDLGHKACVDLGQEDVNGRPDGGQGQKRQEQHRQPPIEAAGDTGPGQQRRRFRSGAHPGAATVIDDGCRARSPVGTGLYAQDAGRVARRQGIRAVQQPDIVSHAVGVNDATGCVVGRGDLTGDGVKINPAGPERLPGMRGWQQRHGLTHL